MISKSFYHEAKALFFLAAPILAAQLAQTMMGVLDTIMAGQVSATDLAAVALANSIWLPALLLVVGLLMALPTLISRHDGAQQLKRVAFDLQQAIWLGWTVVAVIILLTLLSPWLLGHMDIDPRLRALTIQYLHYVIYGAPALVLYQAFRNVCEGLSHSIPSMVVGLIALLLNIPANYAFIYGHWGAPALGGAGCGLATALVQWSSALMMAGYLYFTPRFRSLQLFANWKGPNWQRIGYQFRIGFPMALALFFEVTLFAVVALLLSPLGPKVVASHQIVISFSSIVFMVPLSLSMAVTIRIGRALGYGSGTDAFYSIKVALCCGVGLTCMTALSTLLLRYPIVRLYNEQPEVVELAGQLLLFAVLYQFSDLMQVIGAGALRGLHDSRAIFAITLVGYWLIGLPIGCILGLTDWLRPMMGPQGFWIGITCGLTGAALMYGLRLHYLHGQVLRHPQRFIGVR